MVPESRLKPQVNGSTRPPIFVRLTPKVLEGIAKKQPLKFELQGATARLMVGGLELSGTLQPDPGSFEVFTKENQGYRSNGQVEKRLVLRECPGGGAAPVQTHAPAQAQAQATASPASRESSQTGSTKRKSPSPKHRPLVHVAALGATTPAALARACNFPVEESREFLLGFATAVDPKRSGAGDPFILDDDAYLYVRPWEHSYSPEERKMVIENCKAALDRMKIGPEHTARKSLKKPPTVVPKSSSPAVLAAAADKKKRELKNGKPKDSSKLTKDKAVKDKETVKASKEKGVVKAVKDKESKAVIVPESERGEKPSKPKERDGKLKKPKDGLKLRAISRSVSPQKRPAAGAPLQQPARKRPSTGPSGSVGGSGSSSGSGPALSSASASSSASPSVSPTLNGVSATLDLPKIAEKFHKTYSDYADLYSTLDATPERTRDATQVKKLLAMHRDLAEWKSLLWNSVDSKN